ncbi:hypothetical protein [Paenibacillus taiwanensis]|uniref:hypothetical protein n=1 Tax=Paenibacillus taiwanensis TaxID=401638 RepID=UPI00040D181B|nr:hypothetical protein [Paenibacillus taiwanensis]
MNKMYEFGFLCTNKDEKELMNALYSFLEPLRRTFSKTRNKGMLEARLPYVYKHFYWNLNKEKQVYVEVYPNKDVEGQYKFADENVGWVLFANLKDVTPPYHVPIEEQEKYLADLLSSAHFNYVKLYEYSDEEERL